MFTSILRENMFVTTVEPPLTLLLPSVTRTEFLPTYQYNINQISDEKKEKYQLGDY